MNPDAPTAPTPQSTSTFLFSWDMETFAMGPQTGPNPRPVCLSWTGERIPADGSEPLIEKGVTQLALKESIVRPSRGPKAPQYTRPEPVPAATRLAGAFKAADMIVGQNICFDFGVVIAHLPQTSEESDTLLRAICNALDEGRVYDTKIAEQLMNLAEHGVISEGFVRGIPVKFRYDLATLADTYQVSVPGFHEMKSAPDAWRLRYGELVNTSLSAWAPEAIEYPILDTDLTLAVAKAQQNRRANIQAKLGIDPLKALPLRMRAAFALRMTGAFGVVVDLEEREKARVAAEAIDKEAAAPLIEAGIVEPAQPPQPYKPRGKAGKPVLNPDGTLKMKAAVDEKLNKKQLVAHILSLVEAEHLDIADVIPSDASEKDKEFQDAYKKDPLAALLAFPEYVSTAAEFMSEHAEKDPSGLLQVYRKRQSVQKILTTELPRISPDLEENWPGGPGAWDGIAWPEYDYLKETGRSSSYASKLFPSLNAQNIAAVMRKCYTCPEGTLLLSADFSAMELVSAAQACLDLFGESKLAEILTAGKDAHAYLGAQIAYSQWAAFRAQCDAAQATTVDARYAEFLKLKKASKDTEVVWLDGIAKASAPVAYKHFRTLAKPTGLGLWGGLGAETFVTYAKTTYGVVITLDEAKMLIDIWKRTFPEAGRFFVHLTSEMKDEAHSFSKKIRKTKSVVTVGEDGKKIRTLEVEEKFADFSKYSYTTRGGLHRSNADYCAAANGATLQSPSAEGALMALYEVVAECLSGNFFGAVPYAFVHDEIILVVPQDKETVNAAYKKLDEIMVRNFAAYCAPDVPIRTEPGLMKHWNKKAADTYDANGWLLSVEEVEAGVKECPR